MHQARQDLSIERKRQPQAEQVHLLLGQDDGYASAQGMEFWERLSAFINNNPVQDRDLFYMGMLKPLGIEKGKPFQPDARQRAILEDAARIGDAMGRVMLFHGPSFPRRRAVSRHAVALGLAGGSRPADRHLRPDRRAAALHLRRDLHDARHWRDEGRPRRNYVQAFKDKDGNRLDGGKSYRLHVPANAPAAAFWSLTLYDTGDPLHDPEPEQRLGPLVLDKLKMNADGSIDLYFGPKSPAGIGEQLDRDGSRQGLLPDVPLLQPRRRVCSTAHGSCRTSSGEVRG